jgi:hypothetical protein
MTVDPGKNFLGQRGFPTPNAPIETSACRTFRVPDNDEWLGVLMGAVELLSNEYNWYSWGALTPAEAAAAWNLIVIQAYEESFSAVCPSAPAPYWDDAEDVDDELPDDDEIWYGEVADPEAPPEELTLIDNIAIWTLTGFIAYSGQIGAAIFFHTIAPKFVLAFKAGDVGEIIRIVVDAADYGRVDTTGHAGEIITQNILPEVSEGGHDIMLVKMAVP